MQRSCGIHAALLPGLDTLAKRKIRRRADHAGGNRAVNVAPPPGVGW
jgi:hypothetical protein